MRRHRTGLAVALALVAAAATSLQAASIVVTSPGVSDALIQGNAVALPTDGPRILYHNPAGVTLVRGTQLDYSAYVFSIAGRYRNGDTGYDEKTSEFGGAPLLWLGTDHFDPWFVGFGIFGSVGSSFNFAAEPSAGVANRFLGESAIFQLGLVAGREIAPGLRLGVQLAPNFGRVRIRYPSPFGAVSTDLYGAGIGGAVGVLYEATERLTLGIGYRSPARVFLEGDADVGEEDDRVDLVFHVPQQAEFGFAYRVTDAVTALASARWTDYPDFEDATIDFRDRDELDVPFIANARTTFRYGAAVEWAVLPALDLLAGVSHEEWMMEPESLSPLLYDTADWYFGGGFRTRFAERWTAMGVLSFAYTDDRVVTREENPVFPGRYEFEIPITAGFQIGYQFDTPAGS
jgi:long-subunit fatty acid transport protein